MELNIMDLMNISKHGILKILTLMQVTNHQCDLQY